MNLRERLAKLISERLESHGGLVFVAAKKLIIDFGCDHAEEAIVVTHDAWNKLVRSIDIPLISEESEQRVENEIWDRIELGLRQFKDKVCGDGAETFAGLDETAMSALVDDETLPMVA